MKNDLMTLWRKSIKQFQLQKNVAKNIFVIISHFHKIKIFGELYYKKFVNCNMKCLPYY